VDHTTWTNINMQIKPRLQSWSLPETARLYNPTLALESVAAGFDPISLQQMDAVALLNRIDTKFVMTARQLTSALATLQQDYWMLSINGQRLNHYRTLYFDTPDFDLYHAHVNGRAERYKVRSREYIDSHLSFIEVKHKTRKDRTIKDRLWTTRPVVQMTPEIGHWLLEVYPFDSQALKPRLWNTFTRLTLVSKQYCERVTLDVDLTFYIGDKVAQLGSLAIAEVKMGSNNSASPFITQMRARKIKQQSFSKYAVGVSLLYDQVKKNALKPKLLWIERTLEGSACNGRTW